MIVDSVYFRGHRCFKNDWVGFDSIAPLNIIIGKNNSGKSHLLDLAEALCAGKLKGPGWRFKCHGELDESSLTQVFHQNSAGGDLGGNHWHDHGKLFVGKSVTWEIDENSNVGAFEFASGFDPKSGCAERTANARFLALGNAARSVKHRLFGTKFRRLLADRDIKPEPPEVHLALGTDGRGASNIIRRYIVTSNAKYSRDVIQRDLLAALNEVFGSDGAFTEIQVKQHDEVPPENPADNWEVFLGQKQKGLIPLSYSGSGLKTVLLVLLNLLVMPDIEKQPKSKFTFAFEELENNLHPALLRRLFQYLENYAVTEKATIFLTTHSSTALDLFGVSKNAQIICVTHDGESARAAKVSAHFDRLSVVSELGAKPSDLLQANGIIWVEGPSDCIYINRWLDLYTESELQEGRDYQCAFYGGSLLARTQFTSPEEAEKELINLFRINPNIVVVCDGDRKAKGAQLKARVRRIRDEVRKIRKAHIWITDAREIENYIPGTVLAKAVDVARLPDPNQYEQFFPRKGSPGTSYIEARMHRKSIDKMDLAVLCVSHMDRPMMAARFDWESQMKQIVNRISSWNH